MVDFLFSVSAVFLAFSGIFFICDLSLKKNQMLWASAQLDRIEWVQGDSNLALKTLKERHLIPESTVSKKEGSELTLQTPLDPSIEKIFHRSKNTNRSQGFTQNRIHLIEKRIARD